MKWSEYLEEVKWIKMFLKGPPGTGKTVLAASVSRLGKTLYGDLEGGLIAAKRFVEPKNIDVERIPTTDPRKCTDAVTEFLEKAMSGKYEWVVFDSFSELSGQLEDQYSKGEGSVKDWMSVIEKIKKVGRYFRDGDFNCVVTGLSMNDSADLILPGKSATIVPSFYNITGNIEVRNMGKLGQTRTLVTDVLSNKGVRDRLEVLDPVEKISSKNPEEIFKKILKGIS